MKRTSKICIISFQREVQEDSKSIERKQKAWKRNNQKQRKRTWKLKI